MYTKGHKVSASYSKACLYSGQNIFMASMSNRVNAFMNFSGSEMALCGVVNISLIYLRYAVWKIKDFCLLCSIGFLTIDFNVVIAFSQSCLRLFVFS